MRDRGFPGGAGTPRPAIRQRGRRAPWGHPAAAPLRIGVVAPLVLALAGCGAPGDNLPRQSVSGNVTLDGKSLERGTISFQPVSELPTAIAVPISGGQYYVEKAQGLVPGPYKIKISSTPPPAPVALTAEGTPPPPGKPTPPPRELMPERYNSSTILVREVKEGVRNTFDFPLETGPSKK